MTKTFSILILLLFYNKLSHCQSLQQAHDKIHYAFKLQHSNLDSAQLLLDEARGVLSISGDEEEWAYFHHVLCTVSRKQGKFTTADSANTIAHKQYLKLNDPLGVSMTELERGSIFLDQGMLDSAYNHFEICKKIKEKIKDEEGLGIVMNNIATIYDYKGDYEAAMNYYTSALTFVVKYKNEEMEANIYHNISIIHYNLGNIDAAIEYQNKAIPINKKIGNLYPESMNYVCISSFLLEKGELARAEEMGLRSEEIGTRIKNHVGLLYSWATLGDVAWKQGNDAKALEYYDKFLAAVEKTDDPYMETQVLEKKGNLLLKNNKIELALPLFEKAYVTYNQVKNNKELRDIHFELSKCYKAKGDFTKAFEFLERGLSYQDSVFQQEKVQSVMDLEAKYKNKELHAQQEFKQTIIDSQQRLILGGSIGLILISFLSFFLYRQKEKQRQLNHKVTLQKDQIQTLNRELNHRVKNNLAFMTSLLEMQGRRTESQETKLALKESESRLKALALVHTQLFKNEQDTEINLKHYLSEIIANLQGIFEISDKTLNFKTELIDYSINAEDAMRMGLIVNELVTNSVKHAFHEIANPEIQIATRWNENGKLVLQYKDNGPGISKVMGQDINANSMGSKLIELLKKQLGSDYLMFTT